MEKNALEKKLSCLQAENDTLKKELTEIDRLLHSVGFPKGLNSAKTIAKELADGKNNFSN